MPKTPYTDRERASKRVPYQLMIRDAMKVLDSVLSKIRQLIVEIRNPADLRRGEAAWMRGDHESAISIFMPLAELGCAHAQYCLGRMYDDGLVVPMGKTQRSQAQAVEWYGKAAAQGHADAQFCLAAWIWPAKHSPQEFAESAPWLNKAAMQGHARAQFDLGRAYFNGQCVPKDLVQAFAWYSKAALQGYARAQRALGNMYQFGNGAPKNYAEALVWYRKAAERNPTCAYTLACSYARGDVAPQDYTKAAAWYRKAAEEDLPVAQLELGKLYSSGRGVTRDQSQANVWYRKAAENEDSEAQYLLGMNYLNGAGTSQDSVQALAWIRKAAERHVPAHIALGDIYLNGLVVPQDYAQAIAWYRKASILSEGSGLFNFGRMYGNGQGVPKDVVIAYALISQAAKTDPEIAGCSYLVNLTAEMTPSQIESGQALAHEMQRVRVLSALDARSPPRKV